MARRRSEMTVSFPSPLKDDPPPPYHSCYIPAEALYPPPYNTTIPTNAIPPPPYQSMDPLVASGSGSTQEEPLSIPPSTGPSLPTSTPANPTITIVDPAVPDIDNTTQDSQQQVAIVEEAPSTLEAVGERVPLVVKLTTTTTTSQNN